MTDTASTSSPGNSGPSTPPSPTGTLPTLPALGTDFARYATAAADERSSTDGVEALAVDRRYWADRLASRGEPLRLPYDGDPWVPSLGSADHASEQSRSGADRRVGEAGRGPRGEPVPSAARRARALSGPVERAAGDHGERRPCPAGRPAGGLGPARGAARRHSPLLCSTDPDEPVGVLAERLARIWLESERHAGLIGLDLARLLPTDRAGSGPRTVGPAGFSFSRFPAALDERCPVSVAADRRRHRHRRDPAESAVLAGRGGPPLLVELPGPALRPGDGGPPGP